MKDITETVELDQEVGGAEPLDETIDLEEYARAGKKPPKARRYRFRVDKQVFTSEKNHMTGREILTLADKNPPERFMLFQMISGGRKEKVELDEKVDFTKPGIEKFRTYPLDQTEG
jgi:hypothetical protein